MFGGCMKKIIAAVGTLALAGGLAIAVGAPASAGAGCVPGIGANVTYNYSFTTDSNGLCGQIGASTYFSPSPGIEQYSSWRYSTTAYVESYRLATMIYNFHRWS